MSRLVIIVLAGVLWGACASQVAYQSNKDWTSLEAWDRNDNESLELSEFVAGYHEAGFFKRWSGNSRSISDSTFLFRAFGFLDRNDDQSLDSTEYNSRRAVWSFQGVLHPGAWDDNHNHLLERDEFIHGARAEDLALSFDITADGQITEREMAEGMFETCDKDDNNTVSATEFYHWEVYRR